LKTKSFPFSFFTSALLSIFTACVPAAERAQPKLEASTIVIENEAGENITVNAEFARNAEEQRKGLMFRKKLEDGEGMLFIYERDQILSFWMKNTVIPLSIAFISRDGRILEIRDMSPQSLVPVKSSRSARYALETPQGWFTRANIAPGCLVHIQ
jgi:uncharacterized membrane protein (UPF0127 family)